MGEAASCIVRRKADDIDTDIDYRASSVLPGTFLIILYYFRKHLRYTSYIIPDEIINICCEYCDLAQYPALNVRNRNSIYVICDTYEHVFDTIYIATNGYITCNKPLMKITVLGDLIMESNSMIRFDQGINNGQIILNVFGAINMKSSSAIKAETNGNIYIKCGKLTMNKESVLQTCDKKEFTKSNIEISVRKSVTIHENCIINSGNIQIQCKSIKIDKNVKMNAFQRDIIIKADEKLNIKSKMKAKHKIDAQINKYQ